MKKRLIFVYNADAGLLNSVKDLTHKLVSPETYNCNLCRVTYGNLGMKTKWKKFLKELKMPIDFLHRDEFQKKYNLLGIKFPAVLLEKEEKVDLLIDHLQIGKIKEVGELIQLVKQQL